MFEVPDHGAHPDHDMVYHIGHGDRPQDKLHIYPLYSVPNPRVIGLRRYASHNVR